VDGSGGEEFVASVLEGDVAVEVGPELVIVGQVGVDGMIMQHNMTVEHPSGVGGIFEAGIVEMEARRNRSRYQRRWYTEGKTLQKMHGPSVQSRCR
jgi:hypothetical protein